MTRPPGLNMSNWWFWMDTWAQMYMVDPESAASYTHVIGSPKWIRSRIPSTNQHPISMAAKWILFHSVCGVGWS